MLKNSRAFASFSTDDIAAAKTFYGSTLELGVTEENGLLMLNPAGGQRVLIYPKENHEPAAYTVLNFQVKNIDLAVDELTDRGIAFERYGEGFNQDERGIMRGNGPPIAWFKDPAGNILSVIEG